MNIQIIAVSGKKQKPEPTTTYNPDEWTTDTRLMEKIAREQEPEPEVELTPAGFNYLLPGVEPIRDTPPTSGQARLF